MLKLMETPWIHMPVFFFLNNLKKGIIYVFGSTPSIWDISVSQPRIEPVPPAMSMPVKGGGQAPSITLPQPHPTPSLVLTPSQSSPRSIRSQDAAGASQAPSDDPRCPTTPPCPKANAVSPP